MIIKRSPILVYRFVYQQKQNYIFFTRLIYFLDLLDFFFFILFQLLLIILRKYVLNVKKIASDLTTFIYASGFISSEVPRKSVRVKLKTLNEYTTFKKRGDKN